MLRLVALVLVCLLPAAVSAQEPPPAPPPAPVPAQPEPERSDPDVLVDPLQPDFTLATLPTTLRMPAGRFAFRVTHGLTRDLGEGSFGDTVSDLFGLDGGSQVALELRYGLLPGTQVGVHRTSTRAIQIFGQQNLLNQRDGGRFGLDAIATLEGDENLREHHQGAFGLALSKNLGSRAALYADPILVLNANPFDIGDQHTLIVGLGGRVRVRPSVYVVGEYTPRVAGHSPFVNQLSVAVEKRAGGHVFQINVSNGLGTTYGQLARGAVDYDHWFLGFNLSRKLF
ncbi:MAG TPA: DUF5777 family beta-barrel protein [Vicinamibacterales bacterium]|nr:DUF5777 family beta-barrel protein [Vicinamibacterales bacterium]